MSPIILVSLISGFGNSVAGQNQINTRKEITLLENEKWWGGVDYDGRKMPFGNETYHYNLNDHCGSNQAQPLYLSSKGRFIWSEGPFKIEFASDKILVDYNKAEVLTGKQGETLRDVFNYVSNKFFPASGKSPDPLLFTNPQYNTWIELQYNQNEADILKYAQAILDNGFPSGVLMIDDNWQEYYGTWEFSGTRFRDPKGMIEKLHKMGFKVMLWVVPFVSADTRMFRELAQKKVFLFADKEKTSPAIVKWWNGYSALLDMSNPEAVAWYKSQLKSLQDKYGVDGFKFDAGDPERYLGVYSLKDISPNEQCELHARLGLDFQLNELRACWKLAGQPLAQRLRDKEHTWSDLQALIPDMLSLGLLGYSFGCPDMIGGGEYESFNSSVLEEELVVRSAQVSALMPMMQFSAAPWRILSNENLAICKKMANLHLKMGTEILELARGSAKSGEPIVRNLEYVFPGNGYEMIKDQFLLGDNILVAPVVEKGKREREVIFPQGKWQGDDGTIVEGPVKQLINVPLERLPWYRKKN
jgi:alpha-glucosidase